LDLQHIPKEMSLEVLLVTRSLESIFLHVRPILHRLDIPRDDEFVVMLNRKCRSLKYTQGHFLILWV